MSFEAGNTVRKVTDVQNVYVQRRVLPSTFCISFTGRLTNVLRKKKNCVLSSNLSDFPSRATGGKHNFFVFVQNRIFRWSFPITLGTTCHVRFPRRHVIASCEFLVCRVSKMFVHVQRENRSVITMRFDNKKIVCITEM